MLDKAIGKEFIAELAANIWINPDFQFNRSFANGVIARVAEFAEVRFVDRNDFLIGGANDALHGRAVFEGSLEQGVVHIPRERNGWFSRFSLPFSASAH